MTNNEITLERLARICIREVDNTITLQTIAEDYGIPLIRNNRDFSTARRYEQQRQELRMTSSTR